MAAKKGKKAAKKPAAKKPAAEKLARMAGRNGHEYRPLRAGEWAVLVDPDTLETAPAGVFAHSLGRARTAPVSAEVAR